MASVSKAQLVILSFFVCNCLHSVRSNDQSEPLNSSVGSLGLPSSNQQENRNPSIGSLGLRSYNQQEIPNPSNGSRDLRSYNQQETANPSNGSLGLRSSNQQKNPNPSVTSLGLRSSNQQENPNPFVGSLGLRSSNKQGNLNPSVGSLGLRTTKHQRQRESIKRSVVTFNHRKQSDAERSIGNLDDIKQHEMPKHFLEFFNQHKLTVASSGNANQPRLPQLSTNSLDLWNQHRALRLSTNSLSSPNSHEPSKFSGNSISPNFSRGRKIVCPKHCRCTYCQDRTMCTVDCSNMGLREIPELPKISTNVYLQNNHIKDVPCKKLKYLKNLKELDLSQNKLRRIRNNTFQGLDALVFLSLKENLLKYSSSTFELDAFQGLTSLKSLHLEGNQPNFSENFTYPEEALTRVPTLEYLWLDGFPRRLGPGFSSLRNISHLSFSSPGGNCAMSSKIPHDFFYDVATKKPLHLNLSSCAIEHIPPELFISLPTIHTLDLSSNRKLTMDAFEKGSEGLENSSLTVLNISHWVPVGFNTIKNTTFKHLKSTALKVLVVERCKLICIDPKAIYDLPLTIEYISFHDNILINSRFLRTLITLKNLKKLVLSEQLQSRLIGCRNISRTNFSCILGQNGSERNLSDIRWSERRNRLSEASNLIQNITGKTHMKSELGRWSAVHPFFSSPDSSFNEDKHLYLPLPQGLEFLNASNMKLQNDIPRLEIIFNNVLKHLDLSANIFKKFIGPMYGMPSLEYLDLSRNYCQQVKPLFFSHMPSLRTLLLYQNILGGSLSADSDGVTFSKLALLQNLDLSNNVIEDLPEMLFQNNVNLKVLNLSNNELSCFKPSLINQTELEVLDLSNNLLLEFSKQTCTQFLDIKKANSNFSVHLHGNKKFQCNCGALYFLNFLLDHPGIFENVVSFSCIADNGTRVSYTGLPEILPQLHLTCVNQIIFVTVLSVFSVILGSLAVCSLYHYKRWQLKYLYFVGRSRLHIGSTHINNRPAAHAFLTYDQENPSLRNLMKHQILPRLHQLGLTTVFGEIDFGGGPLEPSIAGAVTATNKTLVFLSKDIFQDYYRQTEVNLAIMHELYLRRPILVPVLLLKPETLSHTRPSRTDRSQPPCKKLGTKNNHHSRRKQQRVRRGTREIDDFTRFMDLLTYFPPEISVFLRGQMHRCLVYSGDDEHFWMTLKNAVMEE